MFKKKKVKTYCDKCGEEVKWLKSKKGKMYAINVGKTEKDQDYFHSSTCIGLGDEKIEAKPIEKIEEQPKKVEKETPEEIKEETESKEKPEEVKKEPEKTEEKQEAKEMKEITVGDILNNHEERIKQLEMTVSKMLEHFGRVYLEGVEKK